MQSTPTPPPSPPSSTSAPSPNNGGAAALGAGNPSANAILRSLRDGQTPLEFIKNNIPQPAPGELNPQAMADEIRNNKTAELLNDVKATPAQAPVTPPASAPTPPPVATKSTTDIPLPQMDGEEVKPEAAATPAPAADAEDDIVDVPNVPAAENFKKLRHKVRENIKKLTEVSTEKEALQQKLQDIESGKTIPETFQQMTDRIAQLEHYEKLHALKLSPQYKTTFIQPLEALSSQASAMAKEYGVPPEAIGHAMSLGNKELNGFLADHFDDVGALEMKSLLGKMNQIRQGAHEAELEPARALQALTEEHQKIEVARKRHQFGTIAERSKGAWVKAVEAIRGEGKARELIYKEGDSKYNDTFVKPVLTAAAQEYGKIVKVLAESGLEQMPEEAAYALARMTLLAHASAVSIESREAALAHAEELERNTKRVNTYNRPTIGGFSNSRANAPAPKPASLSDAVDTHLNNILSRTK